MTALQDRLATEVRITVPALQRLLIDFGLLVEVLFAPGYAALADGAASDAPLRTTPAYEADLDRAIAAESRRR